MFIYQAFMQSFTIWGIILISQQKKDIKNIQIKDVETCTRIIESMALLRLLPLFCWSILCLVLSCMFICTVISGGRRALSNFLVRDMERNATNSIYHKLPIISKFLSQKSRKYNPEIDKGIESCAICMVDFNPKDPQLIAELNCSK